MQYDNEMQIKEAAGAIGIGSRKLFEKLRAHGVLDNKNMARRDLCAQGYFRIDQRSYEQKAEVFSLQRSYAITLVTKKGLDFIQALIKAEENRNAERERSNNQNPQLSGASGSR